MQNVNRISCRSVLQITHLQLLPVLQIPLLGRMHHHRRMDPASRALQATTAQPTRRDQEWRAIPSGITLACCDICSVECVQVKRFVCAETALTSRSRSWSLAERPSRLFARLAAALDGPAPSSGVHISLPVTKSRSAMSAAEVSYLLAMVADARYESRQPVHLPAELFAPRAC